MEKEAAAIVEAVRKWSHFLAARRFKLITDQRSIAFMFDGKNHGKIKNAKILRWRIELSQFDYEIVYRAGEFNTAPDVECIVLKFRSINCMKFIQVYAILGLPECIIMFALRTYLIRLMKVRKMTASCKICAEVKPRFYKPPEMHVIKATKPMERLSIDFKGPIGNLNRNNYMLTVIDQYSRFPLAFPCSNINAETVIKCLTQLFSLFGLCSCIHSDRGSAFMSKEFIEFLRGKGIAYSRTSVYNPRGNGQCEKYNDIIWSGVKLALKSRNWPLSKWDVVLIDVLHSIRSLLCTATNTTPHERFLTFNRRSTLGTSVPSWLSSPGPVLLKRHVRTSKYDPLVDEVELIQAFPTHARVRLQNGREVTVSLRDVAPFGEKEVINDVGLQPSNNTELLPD